MSKTPKISAAFEATLLLIIAAIPPIALNIAIEWTLWQIISVHNITVKNYVLKGTNIFDKERQGRILTL